MNQLLRNRNLQAGPRICSAVRRVAPVFAVLAAILLSAAPARADQTVSNSAFVYTSLNLCTEGVSTLQRFDAPNPGEEINNKGLYGTAYVLAFSRCIWPWGKISKTVPAGWLYIYTMLDKWDGSSWTFCKEAGSTQDGNTFITGTPLAFLGQTPCGSGYYNLAAAVYAYDGTTWRGGWLWSGYLYAQ